MLAEYSKEVGNKCYMLSDLRIWEEPYWNNNQSMNYYTQKKNRLQLLIHWPYPYRTVLELEPVPEWTKVGNQIIIYLFRFSLTFPFVVDIFFPWLWSYFEIKNWFCFSTFHSFMQGFLKVSLLIFLKFPEPLHENYYRLIIIKRYESYRKWNISRKTIDVTCKKLSIEKTLFEQALTQINC